MGLSVKELAEWVGGTVVGDETVSITGCAPIDDADDGDLTFVANARYVQFLKNTRASAVLVERTADVPSGVTQIVCPNPYYAFRNALVALVGFRVHPDAIDPRDGTTWSAHAAIHVDADVHDTAVIHPHVTIERSATIGARTVLYPGVYIGEHARIGDDCMLYPNVVIYDRCMLGDRVILHACTVVGQDGFGFAQHDSTHHKIPQTGIVVIDDDVETGSCVVIERAALGETRIGAGTKMSDLIAIGHGSTIGEHCLFVSLCGISGSVDIDDHVVLGGQVGVTGHLRIGRGVQAMARTAITSDIDPGRKVGGAPAVDIITAKKNALVASQLYELSRRVRALERRLTAGDDADD